jgi:hypothetical protein
MYLILLSMLFPTHYINELSSYQISWFILDNLFMRMCGHFTLWIIKLNTYIFIIDNLLLLIMFGLMGKTDAT